MNLLIDDPPESVFIRDTEPPYYEHEYAINSDFRTGIAFSVLMESDTPTEETVVKAFELYYNGIPENYEAAYEAILWFYCCGEEPEDQAAPEGPPVFSYTQDAPYLYAAFIEQYNIDLTTAKLHWWQFRALMDGLSEKTELMKIIGYRVWKPYKGCPKEEAARMRKLQRKFALKDTREKRQDDRIAEILMGSGDLSQLQEE